MALVCDDVGEPGVLVMVVEESIRGTLVTVDLILVAVEVQQAQSRGL